MITETWQATGFSFSFRQLVFVQRPCTCEFGVRCCSKRPHAQDNGRAHLQEKRNVWIRDRRNDSRHLRNSFHREENLKDWRDLVRVSDPFPALARSIQGYSGRRRLIRIAVRCRSQFLRAPGAPGLRYPADMDIGKILVGLRQEHAQVTEAILSLERMAMGSGKGRGRPPKWMVATSQDVTLPKRRGRPPGSKNPPKTES